MILGRWLVVRGTILGSVVVVLVGLLITSSASFPPPVRAEATPPAAEAAAQSAPARQVQVEDQPNLSGQANGSPGACLVSPNYPQSILQWCDLITRYAGQFGLPPDLIAALILQESGGQPQAYSHSGAVGLMQVMPRDGLAASFMCVNGPCFSNRPPIAELQDPEFNVKYGTRMLAGLLNKYGDMREALKAYGPKDMGYYYADKVLGIYQRYGQ
jgi:soluble lytic murein transglycosylase-like protein